MGEADIALVGGTSMERLIVACGLRRQGVTVHHAYTTSKPKKMMERAIAANWQGRAGVADITDEIELVVVSSIAVDFVNGDP